ncbi:hypothetical protein D3C81_1503270 [compost metagenome]
MPKCLAARSNMRRNRCTATAAGFFIPVQGCSKACRPTSTLCAITRSCVLICHHRWPARHGPKTGCSWRLSTWSDRSGVCSSILNPSPLSKATRCSVTSFAWPSPITRGIDRRCADTRWMPGWRSEVFGIRYCTIANAIIRVRHKLCSSNILQRMNMLSGSIANTRKGAVPGTRSWAVGASQALSDSITT